MQDTNLPVVMELVDYTEDSPIWESQKGEDTVLMLAWRTAIQILKRPERTFAAPRSAGRKHAFRFMLLGSIPSILTILLLAFLAGPKDRSQGMLSKAMNSYDVGVYIFFFFLALLFFPLLVWLGIHLSAIILQILCYGQNRGYDVSYQITCYVGGAGGLLSVVVCLAPALLFGLVGWWTFAISLITFLGLLISAAEQFMTLGALIGNLGMARKRALITVIFLFLIHFLIRFAH